MVLRILLFRGTSVWPFGYVVRFMLKNDNWAVVWLVKNWMSLKRGPEESTVPT